MIPPIGQVVSAGGAVDVKAIFPVAAVKPVYPRP